ncbi:hypothetical protein SAMN05660359_02287 [Geodermatophilus obscurus]|uniref:Diguanylate cyclase n=1 Tax=Geodermatophilus obscurus TaxID=1861 RepID=A0A1I5FPB7_9ACTN|nr:hypothetical protein [Geodermatophilus obscurus]SFO25610.1 hypothetical protein SAMN05660359_02287 [Geodermatophilus obscurus]
MDGAATGVRSGGGPLAAPRRRAPGWLSAGLYRPLAEDDERGPLLGAARPCGATASVGCALLHPDDDVAGVLHRADAALYRAEAAGGDRVHDLAR